MKKICDEGVENLIGGILCQAIEDYKEAYIGRCPERFKTSEMTMRDIKRYLDSSAYHKISNIDGKMLIEKAEEYALKEVIDTIRELLDRNAEVKLYKARSGKEKSKSYTLPPNIAEIVKAALEKVLDMLEDEMRGKNEKA